MVVGNGVHLDRLLGGAIEEHVAGGMSTTMSFRGDVRGERMGDGAVTRAVAVSTFPRERVGRVDGRMGGHPWLSAELRVEDAYVSLRCEHTYEGRRHLRRRKRHGA